MDVPVEMRVAILEECDLKALRFMRQVSKNWYDLATIELFRRSSAEAITAQKFILHQYLSSYINTSAPSPSKFKLSRQAHAQLRSLYFAKNTRAPDSSLTALMAAAVLIFDYDDKEKLTRLQENQLKHDILLATLDESTYEHTLLALMAAFGKNQVSDTGITALENILAGHYRENGTYFEQPAFETIGYVAQYLNEAQGIRLVDNLITILGSEGYDSCKLASDAFEAIAARIPAQMVKPIVNGLQNVMRNHDHDMDLSITLIIRAICLFIPRLAPEDFADFISRQQQKLTHDMARNNIPRTVIAIDNLTKIVAAASKEQLHYSSPILYNVILSALTFAETDPLHSYSGGILLDLMRYKLFSIEQCDTLMNRLFDLIRAHNVDASTLGRFLGLLCDVASEASPAPFNEVILVLGWIIRSRHPDYQALQASVLPGLQILAPRMSEAQIRDLIRAYELLLDKSDRLELALAAINYLAPLLPQKALSTTVTTLQQHLLNPGAETLPGDSAGLFSTEPVGHQEAFFICKRLGSIVYSIPKEQAAALLDTLIARMTDRDVRVRILASQAASILFLRFPFNEVQTLDRIMAAFLDSLTDTEAANRAQTIKIFIRLAAHLSAQQLSAIIDMILTQQLLGDPDEAVHQAAAEFFLVFAKEVPAENLMTACNQLYDSNQRYGADFNLFAEGIRYVIKDEHKAHDAFVALALRFTTLQLHDFIEKVALEILALDTLDRQPQNGHEMDSAWTIRVLLNLSLLDTMIALIKRSPEIPLMKNLINAFYHKMDASNQVDVRYRAKIGFLELVLHHLPEAALPLCVPAFLERANFEDDGYLIEAITKLIPRLPNNQLGMLIAPLHAKLQEELQNNGPIPSVFCEAIFAMSRRIPAEKIVPNEIWHNANHRVKFPLLFQLFFNEYQKTAHELVGQAETHSYGRAQKNSAEGQNEGVDKKRQRLL